MRNAIKQAFACIVAFMLFPGASALAASPSQRELKDVLQQLDTASANFHSASADFIFVTVQTDPIPDKLSQKGVIDYKRNGKKFQMAAHIRFEAEGEGKDKPVPKDLIYTDGKVTLYEKLTNQAHVKDASKFEGYLLLGFGASGKELADKWDITYLGAENLNDGKTTVATDKLELVAKDPDFKKMFPKVTIWIDPARGVSLKQIFDEGQGQSRTCFYFNIKLNSNLPDSDFTIKTDSQTQIIR